MSLRNKEKCPYLRDKGVSVAQNGYSAFLIGHSGCRNMDIDQSNKIKDYCLECPLDPEHCIYDDPKSDAK